LGNVQWKRQPLHVSKHVVFLPLHSLSLTLPRANARFSQSSSVAVHGGALLNHSRNAAITQHMVCPLCCLSHTHTVCPLCCLSNTHTVCPLCCLSHTHTVCPLCCLSCTHTVCPLCCLSHTHTLCPLCCLSCTHTSHQAFLDIVTACVSRMENTTKFCGCGKSCMDYLGHCCQPTILHYTSCCAVLRYPESLRCVLSGCTMTSPSLCTSHITVNQMSTKDVEFHPAVYMQLSLKSIYHQTQHMCTNILTGGVIRNRY
jgi:hypothetical protein